MRDLTDYKKWLKESEVSEHTIDSYETGINLYFSKYNDITKDNLIDWKEELLEKYKPKTAFLRLCAMNSYMYFKGYPANIKVKMPRIPKISYIENIISEDEYRLLINKLYADKNYKYYLTIKMLAHTGLRVSELINLTFGDVYRGIYDVCGKGKKYRRVYIPQKISQEVIDIYGNKKNDEFFITNERGGKITTRGIAHQLSTFAEKYGINRKVCHPHAFRHFFAKQFLKKSKDIALLADLLGHGDIETTRIYLRNSSEEQKEKINEIVDW